MQLITVDIAGAQFNGSVVNAGSRGNMCRWEGMPYGLVTAAWPHSHSLSLLQCNAKQLHSTSHLTTSSLPSGQPHLWPYTSSAARPFATGSQLPGLYSCLGDGL